MVTVFVPGYGEVTIEHIVVDYNGTIALDGRLIESLDQLVPQLASLCQVHVITADTHGTVEQQCSHLPVSIGILSSQDHLKEKAEYVHRLSADKVMAIGNGENDWQMLQDARLGVAVIGPEGCSGKSLRVADIVVRDIADALMLVLKAKRLIATLRTQ